MDKQKNTTDETLVSKAKEEIIKESKRIEESLLHSSKGHFSAARFWKNFHLWLGIPIVVLSGVLSASAFGKFDKDHWIAGILSLIVVGLSSIMTFLNPNEKSNAHLNAGNNYDGLMNKVRIFWTIECWREESEQVITAQLKSLSEQKSKLNKSCPQIPKWAYRVAKKGIINGEGEYLIDKKQ